VLQPRQVRRPANRSLIALSNPSPRIARKVFYKKQAPAILFLCDFVSWEPQAPGHPVECGAGTQHQAATALDHYLHHCCSHGTPSLFPSILLPGQFLRKQVASAHELIWEQCVRPSQLNVPPLVSPRRRWQRIV